LLKRKDTNKWIKIPILFLGILIFLSLTIIIPMITTPVRRSSTMIRNYIVRITPIGTRIEDVIQVIEDRDDWGVPHINYEFGIAPQRPWIRIPHGIEGIPDLDRIGEMSVSSNMGTHFAWYRWFPLMEFSVVVYWAFDEDGELVEVFVARFGMI